MSKKHPTLELLEAINAEAKRKRIIYRAEREAWDAVVNARAELNAAMAYEHTRMDNARKLEDAVRAWMDAYERMAREG